MKCFFSFKDRSKTRQTKSAPETTERRKSENSAANRINKSASEIDSTASSSHRNLPSLYEEKAHNLRVFSFSELRAATNGFNRLLKLGEGGFGSVYKGFVNPSDGIGGQIAVAIKKLNKESLQGHKQWMAEVQFLAVVEHPNLVKLIGYCAEDTERGIERLLIYEFIPNRTLEDHLFNRSLPVLPWNRRLEIVLGAAQGLAYLHGGLDVQVIYRDFKASNVLLDMEFKPKLSDFGLAREGPSLGRSHVSTAVVGTYGYADPDYVNTGHLTLKSDVWSFGVVLYEILTGRRALDRERPKMEQKLLDWVKQFPADSKKFFMIMDPRLRNQYSPNAAQMIAKLADSCLSKSSKDRPTMAELVEVLKQAIQVSEIAGLPETATMSSSVAGRVTDKNPAQINIPRRQMEQVAKPREHANAVGITVGVQRK